MGMKTILKRWVLTNHLYLITDSYKNVVKLYCEGPQEVSHTSGWRVENRLGISLSGLHERVDAALPERPDTV